MFHIPMILVVTSILSSNPIAAADLQHGAAATTIRHSLMNLDVRAVEIEKPPAVVPAKAPPKRVSISQRIAGAIGGTLVGVVAGGYLGLKFGGGECPQPMVWGATIGGVGGAIIGAIHFYAKTP